VCEWVARTDGYRGSELMTIRMIAVIAVVYLTAFLGSRRKLVAGILFAVGAISLTVKVIGLPFSFLFSSFSGLLSFVSIWNDWATMPQPKTIRGIGIWGMIALALLFAWRLKRDAWVPAVVVLLASIVLPHCYVMRNAESRGDEYSYVAPSVIAFLLVAALACFLAWWGERERSRALINYGVVAFALTVLWFYVSSIMDNLNRSLNLIVLGLLFLCGGWLEKLRRRMVGQVNREGEA
jgi:hypothetical protein